MPAIPMTRPKRAELDMEKGRNKDMYDHRLSTEILATIDSGSQAVAAEHRRNLIATVDDSFVVENREADYLGGRWSD